MDIMTYNGFCSQIKLAVTSTVWGGNIILVDMVYQIYNIYIIDLVPWIYSNYYWSSISDDVTLIYLGYMVDLSRSNMVSIWYLFG